MSYPKRIVSTLPQEVGSACNIYLGLDSGFDVDALDKIRLQRVQLWGKNGEFELGDFPHHMQGFDKKTNAEDTDVHHVFIGGTLVEFDSSKFMINFDLRVDPRTGIMDSSCTFSHPPPSSLGSIRVVLELVRKKDT